MDVWHAYGSYFPNNGDLIPQSFTRQAKAHRVSGRQFSKRNTAQGLMLVTSLIVLINER